MAHSSTELLIDYWQARVRDGQAPTRATINPVDFPTILPQIFILGRHAPGEASFRLVGGLVAELHGRDLRGVGFSSLWAQSARLPLQTEMERIRRRPAASRFAARIEAGLQTLDLEIALMPLANASGEIDRFLGIYQPRQPVARLRGQTADRLQLLSFSGGAAEAEGPNIRLAAVGGRRIG
jgi:hypothetical protein